LLDSGEINGKPASSSELTPPTPTSAASPGQVAPSTNVIPMPGIASMPPLQTAQAAQSLQMLIQAGVMPAPALPPETVKHITEYLCHDSDNKLEHSKTEGKRRLILRMTAIIVGALLFFILLAMPLVALIRGDSAFVNSFLEHHMAYLVSIVLAIIGGAGLKGLFKS
jgi:hypothetical protein